MRAKPPVWRPVLRVRWRIDLVRRLSYERGVQVGRAMAWRDMEDAMMRAGWLKDVER